MPALLFLSHRIPYPPNKGEKIRALRILEHLSRRYRIHLGCFIDDPEDRPHRAALKSLCAEVACFDLPARSARLRAAQGLLTGAPLTVAMFRHEGMDAWVQKTLATVRPAVVFGYSSAVGQYVMGRNLGSARFVMDFVDVDSDKWRQYAATARGPMRWIYAREAERLLAYDRALARRADAATLVSDAEAELFRRLAPESAAKIHAVANGIDCIEFDPARSLRSPFATPGPHLVFTGTMDYRPNIDAVVWFATEILPLVHASVPDAVFTIVGAKPTREVQSLAGRPGIAVTGRVDDVRPYLKHADVIVAPLRLARGIQNKVLEGLAMARPLVTTPQGLEGIDAQPGRELLVADSPEAFAAAVCTALEPQAAILGAAARELMLAAYAWPSRLAKLDTLMPSHGAPVRPRWSGAATSIRQKSFNLSS